MISIRELDHLVLRVSNLDAMLRFYSDALGCVVERRLDSIGLVQLRAGRSLLDLVPVDGPLGRTGARRPGRKAATWTTSAFVSNPSTKLRSVGTSRGMAFVSASSPCVTARKAKARRSTSPIPKATPSNSKGHRVRRQYSAPQRDEPRILLEATWTRQPLRANSPTSATTSC